MRVCVIGNSHVAAVKAGCSDARFDRAWSLDFFAVPAGSIHVEGDRLVGSGPRQVLRTTPSDALELGPFDAVLVSAVGNWAFRNENWRHILFHLGICGWGGNLQQVSHAVFRKALRQVLADTQVVRLCRDLPSIYAGQLYFQPWPLPSEGVLEDSAWRMNEIYGEGAAAVVARYHSLQYELLQELLGGAGTLLPYPEAAWLERGVTPRGLVSEDPWHMNDRYGAAVLAQLQDALAAARARPQVPS